MKMLKICISKYLKSFNHQKIVWKMTFLCKTFSEKSIFLGKHFTTNQINSKEHVLSSILEVRTVQHQKFGPYITLTSNTFNVGLACSTTYFISKARAGWLGSSSPHSVPFSFVFLLNVKLWSLSTNAVCFLSFSFSFSSIKFCCLSIGWYFHWSGLRSIVRRIYLCTWWSQKSCLISFYVVKTEGLFYFSFSSWEWCGKFY